MRPKDHLAPVRFSHICKWCHEFYIPKKATYNDFCSRPCSEASRLEVRTEKKHESERKRIERIATACCAKCSTPIAVSEAPKHNLYCEECKILITEEVKAKGRQRQRDREAETGMTDYQRKVGYQAGSVRCKHCGQWFHCEHHARKRFYCGRRCMRNARNSRDRFRKRISEKGDIRKSLFELYKERNEYKKEKVKNRQMYCGICGMEIDPKLKYPHSMSFSIDHVVPLSRGGTNDKDNLQPAHFICNSTKSYRLQSELA